MFDRGSVIPSPILGISTEPFDELSEMRYISLLFRAQLTRASLKSSCQAVDME